MTSVQVVVMSGEVCIHMLYKQELGVNPQMEFIAHVSELMQQAMCVMNQ